jgi:hypothetical protein
MLANSLWYRYRSAPDWGWRVWDNTFASLRLKPDVAVDIVTAQARARCYAEFLLAIDQHLPAGLDEHIARWLAGPGVAELVAIDAAAWDCVIFALLFLVVHGALAATTVLQGLVYPLWQFALAPPAASPPAQAPDVYLRAAHDIFARLLLNTACTPDGIPPAGAVQLQRVRTRRGDVFARAHIATLVAHVPTLVFLEHCARVGPELGALSGALRCAVCEVPEFRQGVYRDLNAVREAFESSSKLESLDESLVEHLMDALRLILNVAKAGVFLHPSAVFAESALTPRRRRRDHRFVGLARHVRAAKPVEARCDGDRGPVYAQADGRAPCARHAACARQHQGRPAHREVAPAPYVQGGGGLRRGDGAWRRPDDRRQGAPSWAQPNPAMSVR